MTLCVERCLGYMPMYGARLGLTSHCFDRAHKHPQPPKRGLYLRGVLVGDHIQRLEVNQGVTW